MERYKTNCGYTIHTALHMTATERRRIGQVLTEVAKTHSNHLENLKIEYKAGRERWIYSRDVDTIITRIQKEKDSLGKTFTRKTDFYIKGNKNEVTT